MNVGCGVKYFEFVFHRYFFSVALQCPPDEEGSDELDMPKVGGVFVVVLVGTAAGVFIGILEFLWNTRQVAIQRKVFHTIFFLK